MAGYEHKPMDFQVQWDGLEELIDLFGEMNELVRINTVAGMEDYTALVETGARELAQYFDGDLAESIVARDVVIKSGVVTGEVGSVLIYAWRRHEEPYRKGRHDLYDRGIRLVGFYKDGLGARSRGSTRMGWRGQMPGRKYLERAIVASEEDFQSIFDNVLAATLNGNRYMKIHD